MNFLVKAGVLVTCLIGLGLTAQPKTYCNPIDLDYTYMIYNADQKLSYRSGADPTVVNFRGEYYMFVTRSLGYWHSKDLTDWTFITPEKWYFQGSNAPAARNYKDSLLYVMGDPSGAMSVLYTDNPKKGDWKALPYILTDLQDPDLFFDDDGEAYVYWGSSNKFPIRGKKLDRQDNFRPSKIDSLFNLNETKHGWERFGENNSAPDPKGYIEGPWMTKHKNKYYLQYAAPGTEFNVYGDGYYTSEHPLGPFSYAPNNPFSFKPGGFINGAGHGSTVEGPADVYWHFASMAVNVNVGWERRIGMFPTFFDKEGLLYSDTYFGDYPRFAPNQAEKNGAFTGWMLLSYKKPVTVSSVLENYKAENMVDENVKTFWVASRNDAAQWIQVDLQQAAEIHAVQINFNDYKSEFYGRVPGLFHRFMIEGSVDGKNWSVLADRSASMADSPNAYLELSQPTRARFIRFKNVHNPTKNLSISDFRVFGKGSGVKPPAVKNFEILRHTDRRDAAFSWNKSKNAQGYNVLWGIAPDKLYSSWMVYGDNKLEMRNLNTEQEYYFAIEAFNENGIGARSAPVKIK